jgi:hypothetical protein
MEAQLTVIGEKKKYFVLESWRECGLLADGQAFSAMSTLENPPWSSE